MPWSGSGTFNRLLSWVADATAGIDINATRMDTDTDDIVTGLNNTRTLDGQTEPIANLPMNGFKHTGASAASASGEYLEYGQNNASLAGLTMTGTITMADSGTWGSGGISGLTGFIVGRTTNIAEYLNTIKTADGSVKSALAVQDGNPVNGDALIGFQDAGGTTRGSIAWNGTTAVQYNTTSDARLKTLTGSIASGAMIDAVSPHTFTWNETGQADFGFFAQELYGVVPSAVVPGSPANVDVTDTAYKPWQIGESKLVSILWAEVQSLRARLKAAAIP